MHRFRTFAVAGAAALGLAGAVVAGLGGPATASGETEIGTQVLDLLCASKSGTPFFTPFTVSRCQDARTRDGFVLEQLICEGLLDGTFQNVPSPTRPSRVNWACVRGATTP